MRCLVVEDEPHWQTTIAGIIAGHDTLSLVATCTNLAEALATIRAADYDLLIADLGLPDGNGIDAIRTSRRLKPDAHILVATVFDDERSVVNAICAGATGYLVKDSSAGEWLSAIEQLRAGHSPLSPKIARHILRRMQEPQRAKRMGVLDAAPAAPLSASAADEHVSLSVRESEVLQLVAKGFSLVEVAQIMHVSHTTTRSHAQSIYRKLEVNSRGEAVFEAQRLGLL